MIRRIEQQTSELFSEFDASSRAILMEDLEILADKVSQGNTFEAEEMANKLASEYGADTDDTDDTQSSETMTDEEILGEIISEEIIEDEMIIDEQEDEAAIDTFINEGNARSEELEDSDEVEEIEEVEEVIETDEAELVDDTDEAELIEEADDTEEAEAVEEAYAPERPCCEKAAKLSVREFSREETDMFGKFANCKQAKIQIANTIDQVSLAAYTGNVIITGDNGSGTIKLAKNLIKNVALTDGNFSGKVAKITADVLNSRDTIATMNKLVNGALIIEKAGALTDETIQNLLKGLEQENKGIIVILEDTKKATEKLIARNEKLLNNFNCRIDLAELNNDALVAYAKEYALSKEYVIDEFGILALYERIEELQTSEHCVNTAEVAQLVDKAIHVSNKKNIRHFIDVLVSKRYDDQDMIVLRERDFAL
ncbi:MAG: hypothetical protein HGA25_01955 [Clostridiales bacterium]|nr:hypothetical protein [Clostridiales bacterium]